MAAVHLDIRLDELAIHKELYAKGLRNITLIRTLMYLWKVNQYMRAFVVNCLAGNPRESLKNC